MIRITLSRTAKPGRYAAFVPNEVWREATLTGLAPKLPLLFEIAESRQPVFDGCRALLDRDPSLSEEQVEVRWHGSDVVAMTGIVAELAYWTVSETNRLSLRKWEAFTDEARKSFEDAPRRVRGRAPGDDSSEEEFRGLEI